MLGVNGRIHPFSCISPVKENTTKTQKLCCYVSCSKFYPLTAWHNSKYSLLLKEKIVRSSVCKSEWVVTIQFWFLYVLCEKCTKWMHNAQIMCIPVSSHMFQLQSYSTHTTLIIYTETCHMHLLWPIWVQFHMKLKSNFLKFLIFFKFLKRFTQKKTLIEDCLVQYPQNG